uniref:Putative zinc finger, CCHC-type n=1 Tax=Tanacetum cinerariifolium TaxID=118510 RepID=A0A6L2MF71_TANCI|nr:putative zinc finger, CCHC-type [Tanacetum cinerariifolium]
MDCEEFDNTESFEHLFMAEPENAESTFQFDAEEYEKHQENPNQETPTEFLKSDIKQYFTFDDVPPSKWCERSIEMLTWCTAELQYYTIDVVIKRFLTRLQERLRDWYHRLGEYRQLQIRQSISPEAFMSIRYSEFIGSPWEYICHAREEFLKMKCCSFQKKDLEKHYDRMSQRFYCLNGVNDVNLKQVFLNSFPESLGNEAYQALEARNVTIAQTTIAELYRLILNALAKLCNQKKFLAEFERTGKRLGTACDDKYMQIKCKDKSSCDCTHKKNKFHSKRFSSLSGKPRFSRGSSKNWKFIRKKKQRGRTSDRCFICQKRGHFARNCPDKKRSHALIQALNQVEPVDVSDLESLYSLDDEPSDSVLCTIAYSDLSSNDDSDTDSPESDSDFGIHMINPIPHVLPIQEDPPLPLAKIHLLTDAYAKPIPVIAFFDTDVNPTKASHPGMNPDHYQLAKEECEQLVSQDIIEPTTSPWACEAFYVNKRSEQVREKLRLVINYQPLNHFLADDKFSLPQKKSLFQHLANAIILSKFDLKSGFWQLAFQKAMITIFEPILANTLVYIDDILLFSSDEQSHAKLLSKFYSLVTKYEIILSEKKMKVGVTTIQFLGMEISDGKY